MDPVNDNQATGGSYEIQQINMKTDCASWKDDLVSIAKSWENDESKLFGAWSSVFGPLNTGILLWRHQNIDTADRISQKLRTSKEGKILKQH